MLKFQKQQKSLRINIIPLIDIIFLMLVFFMLATNFSKNKEISFTANNQKQVSNQSNDKNFMILNINDNKIFFENEQITLDHLEKKYFENWQNLNFEKIIILNDKRSSIQTLFFLLDTVKKNEIFNVIFSDEP